MDFRPSNLIFHDYGGSPANEDGVFNPYHALVFPDGNIRYRNPANPYGGKAPHAFKMNPESIGLSYAGPVGSKPTPQALATLRKEAAKVAQMFPGIQPMSHGQAFNATKGTSKQASKLGRGLDEASWRSNVVYGPPAPGQSEPQPATPMAGRSLTAYAGLSGPQAQPAPTQTNEAPTMPNQTGVPIPASYSPDTISAQRRMAMQLMQQGTDASPVQHLTQALARVLQGGMGGYQMAQADKQDRMMQGEGNALMGEYAKALTGGPSPAGMPQGQPQMVGQALAGETAPMTPEEQGVARFASPGLAAAMPQQAPMVPTAGPVQVADAGPTIAPEMLQRMLANPQTRGTAEKYIQEKMKAKDNGQKPLDLNQRANNEHAMRKEYATLAKPYFDVRDAYARVEQSTKAPSAAGDLALIFNFMKMLDPGSVVREGEFATAQNAAGVPDQIRNIFNRVASGERLNDNQRGDFVGQARGLMQVQERQYKAIQEQYRGIAQRSGIDPQNVIVDFTAPKQDETPTGAVQSGTYKWNPQTGKLE